MCLGRHWQPSGTEQTQPWLYLEFFLNHGCQWHPITPAAQLKLCLRSFILPWHSLCFVCYPEQSRNNGQKWPLWTQQCWPISDLVNGMHHLSATSLTCSSQASVSMASYYFSKEFQLCLILLLSCVFYLLLGYFSLYEEETSSDDIPIEKLCENIYWEIAHLSLVASPCSWLPQSKLLFNLITGNL